jgi:hypothetical protein
LKYTEFDTIEAETLTLINSLIEKWKDCWPEKYSVTVQDIFVSYNEKGYSSGYNIYFRKGKKIEDEMVVVMIVNNIIRVDLKKLEHRIDSYFYEMIYDLIT